MLPLVVLVLELVLMLQLVLLLLQLRQLLLLQIVPSEILLATSCNAIQLNKRGSKFGIMTWQVLSEGATCCCCCS